MIKPTTIPFKLYMKIFIFFCLIIFSQNTFPLSLDSIQIKEFKELVIKQEKYQKDLDECASPPNKWHADEKEQSCIKNIKNKYQNFIKDLDIYNNKVTSHHKNNIEFSYYVVFCLKNSDKVLYPTTQMLLEQCDNRIPSFTNFQSGQISLTKEMDMLAVLCEDSFSTSKIQVKCNQNQLNEVLNFVRKKLEALEDKEDKKLVKKIYPSIFFKKQFN